MRGEGDKDGKGSSGEVVRLNAKQKVENLLRKREAKMAKKEEIKISGKVVQSVEDKEIVRQVKNKKRENRRERAGNEDEFETMFNSYKDKLEKKLDSKDKKAKEGKGKEEKGKKESKKAKKEKADFEEVIMSD